MPRKNVKFYKSTSTDQQLRNITSCLKYVGEWSKGLATGKFSKSWFAGTSMEPLDMFKATKIAMQDVDSIFLRNSVISLLYNNHQAHHSFSAFLAAHFLSNETKIKPVEIMLKSRCARLSDVNSFYEALISDERTLKLFTQIRETGGSSASVSFRVTPAKEDAVTLSKNNIYPLGIPGEFWRYCQKDRIELSEPDILVVDGVVMTVGEINGYLLSANENKRPLIVMCRGMSEEVLATLLKNYSMGRLNVFPIQIPVGEEANILHDFAYLSGAETVSTITGDVLASKDEECLGKVRLLTIFKDNIEINIDEKEKCEKLVAKIDNERSEYISEFTAGGEFLHIFDMRKSAASSEVCKVYVSKNKSGQEHIISDRLKSLSLIHNEIKENGVVDISSLSSDPALMKLSKLGFSTLPVSSLIYAIKSANDLKKKLITSSRVMILD